MGREKPNSATTSILRQHQCNNQFFRLVSNIPSIVQYHNETSSITRLISLVPKGGHNNEVLLYTSHLKFHSAQTDLIHN